MGLKIQCFGRPVFSRLKYHSLFMLGGGLVRSIRKQNKTFWPLPRKTKNGTTALNVLLKTGYPSPPPPPNQKKNVCKNENTKGKLWLLSVWTSLHHYMELILLILSDVLCSLSCAGTIINRQAIYNKRFFLDLENKILSLSLQEYAEMEEERMQKCLKSGWWR